METLQRTANRGSISTGYDIDNSLKLEADNTEYLEKANDSGTNRKTFTVSMWFKRTELANDYMQLWQGGANGEATRLGFYGGTPKEAIWVDIGGGSGNTGTLYRSYSTQVLRDTSAWYHIVLAVDTTQATEADRFRLWLNGSEVTDWSQRQYPAQNFQCALEASINMRWGAYDATYYKMSGYIAECHYLDGVAKVQTDFGEYDEDSGIWKPKEYTGSYGGNGCYLDFENSASLGADSSGNGNNFTLNNITAADQATDTPTNNFAILNPLLPFDQCTIFEGATRVKKTTTNRWRTFVSTQGVSNGKWYAEFQNPLQSTTGSNRFVGVIPVGNITQSLSSTGDYTGGASYNDSFGFYYDGKYWENNNGTVTENTFGSAWTTEIIGIALDMDNGYAYFSINGTWQNSGSPTSGSSGTGGIALLDTAQAHYIAVSIYNDNADFQCNYGGYTVISIASGNADANGYGNFEYAPPSGYYALCSKNLAEYG